MHCMTVTLITWAKSVQGPVIDTIPEQMDGDTLHSSFVHPQKSNSSWVNLKPERIWVTREFFVGNSGRKFSDFDSYRKSHTQKSDNLPVGINPSVHLMKQY